MCIRDSLYFGKPIVAKIFYGATAAGGFTTYARYIPNPETYTMTMRKSNFSWLKEPRLLETMGKYGVQVTLPGFENSPSSLD